VGLDAARPEARRNFECEFHLVRVTTDDREKQLWVAAAPREDAVALVLGAAPEGWSAALHMRLGDVRELAI
jgi:hypothetical protein